MSTRPPEQTEGVVDLAPQGLPARAGFRFLPGDRLAGAPIELEFFVDVVADSVLSLAVSGDRARQRPGQFLFATRFEGAPLDDPMKAYPDAGGPMGMVEVTKAKPWRQRLLLNQFVRLEDIASRLRPGAVGRLSVRCQRSIELADAAAPSIAVNLGVDLRRDDESLVTLADGLVETIRDGAPERREPALDRLLAMRSAAAAAIDALTQHPEPSVAARARQVAQTMKSKP